MKLIGRDGAGLAVTVETVRLDGVERLRVRHAGYHVGTVRLPDLATTLRSVGARLEDMEEVTE